MISPHDIIEGYSKLPQSATEQAKTTENNIFGSPWLMDTLSLLGKSYFSQIDTNNTISSEFANIHYGRSISVAVVDFTPDIYTQLGETILNRQGKIGIDVLGNQTVFTSRVNNLEEESKIRHATGFLSSFYESEVIEQFTGLQAVSTAEVLNISSERNIEILYLSSANISELNNSKLSDQNKVDITKLINEGNYVTVPSEEISIGNWSGTGYIVYDPVTDLNSYIINTNLNGGQLCSWVGLAYLGDILATVVECIWAFDLIMFGATILGAGLIFLSGPIGIAVASIVLGLGLIVSGAFYLKNIGDRLYESTELMNAYIDGDETAGEYLKLKSALHVGGVATGHFGGKLLAKPISKVFAKFHLEEKVGRLVSNAFANTPGGYTQAIDILNRISPKYTKMLSYLVGKYGSGLSSEIANAYVADGIGGVEKLLERESLFDELAQAGEKFTKENTLWITRNADGKICWLETGTDSAGFQHILKRHMNGVQNDFAVFGIATESELLNFLNSTVSTQIPVGTIGSGGTVYQVGDKYLNVVISSNGFIVNAYNVTHDIARIIFY